jgi:hypothetical protein
VVDYISGMGQELSHYRRPKIRIIETAGGDSMICHYPTVGRWQGGVESPIYGEDKFDEIASERVGTILAPNQVNPFAVYEELNATS